jgi:hypothetical protein
MALVNSAVTLIAFFEVVAPELMELPHHHCVYCMWQYAPDSILMTAFFVMGTFSAGWAYLVYLAGRHRETGESLGRYLRNLCFLGIIGISASLAMVTVHLLL